MQIYELKQKRLKKKKKCFRRKFAIQVKFLYTSPSAKLAAADPALFNNSAPARTWQWAPRSTTGLFRSGLRHSHAKSNHSRQNGQNGATLLHSVLSDTLPCYIAPLQKIVFGIDPRKCFEE